MKSHALVRRHATVAPSSHPTPILDENSTERLSVKYHLTLSKWFPVYQVTSHLLPHPVLTMVLSRKMRLREQEEPVLSCIVGKQLSCYVNPSPVFFPPLQCQKSPPLPQL